ncbi:MAG: glycosyltransferase [bacterium]
MHDPKHPRANANGPYMPFRRDCYDAIGGHAAIPYEVVEDLVLARNVKAKGFAIRWALAPELGEARALRELARPGSAAGASRSAMEIDRRELWLNLLGPIFLLAFVLALPRVARERVCAARRGLAFASPAFTCSLAACLAAATSQRLWA